MLKKEFFEDRGTLKGRRVCEGIVIVYATIGRQERRIYIEEPHSEAVEAFQMTAGLHTAGQFAAID